MNNWHEVSKSEPCPICGHDHWCILSNDGEMCVCRRTENDRPTKSGSGWIHRLSQPPSPQTLKTSQPQNLATSSSSVSAYFATLPQGETQVKLCRYLMRQLTLPSAAMELMDVRWDASCRAAAFPMRDGAGDVIGIRYRDLKTGKKWALRGSHNGLFIVPEYIPVECDEIVVCEGPTDTLAAVSCGMYAIGRACCQGGADHIREYLRRHRAKRLVVAADADEPKTRPDGSVFRPGIDGAKALVKALGMPARIVLPPIGFKDVREWYARGGLTQRSFAAAVAGAKWQDECLKGGVQ